jgi:hypothetical protein
MYMCMKRERVYELCHMFCMCLFRTRACRLCWSKGEEKEDFLASEE